MSTVPLLEVEEGGTTLRLAQSMAILEWLEERHPDRPLLPRDAAGRARVRAIAEDVNSSVQPYQNSSTMKWLREHEAGLDVAFTRHFLGRSMAGLEAAVRGGAGRFCHGDEVTLADLFVVPQMYGARRVGVDVSAFPTLLRVEASCMPLDAFARSVPDAQPDAPDVQRHRRVRLLAFVQPAVVAHDLVADSDLLAIGHPRRLRRHAAELVLGVGDEVDDRVRADLRLRLAVLRDVDRGQ